MQVPQGEKAGEEDRSEAASEASGFFTPNEKIDFTNAKIEPLFDEQVDFDIFSESDFQAVKVKECFAAPKSRKLLKFVLDDRTGTYRIILSGIYRMSFYFPILIAYIVKLFEYFFQNQSEMDAFLCVRQL